MFNVTGRKAVFYFFRGGMKMKMMIRFKYHGRVETE